MNTGRSCGLAFVALLTTALSITTFAQSKAPAKDASKEIPVLDGGIGPCSADLTITDSAGAPIYAAKVKVHIAYGFMSARKLDLELGTNADGRARFTGLPDRIKHGFYFQASEGDRSGQAFDDPTNTCRAAFTIQLQKAKDSQPASQQ